MHFSQRCLTATPLRLPNLQLQTLLPATRTTDQSDSALLLASWPGIFFVKALTDPTHDITCKELHHRSSAGFCCPDARAAELWPQLRSVEQNNTQNGDPSLIVLAKDHTRSLQQESPQPHFHERSLIIAEIRRGRPQNQSSFPAAY